MTNPGATLWVLIGRGAGPAHRGTRRRRAAGHGRPPGVARRMPEWQTACLGTGDPLSRRRMAFVAASELASELASRWRVVGGGVAGDPSPVCDLITDPKP